MQFLSITKDTTLSDIADVVGSRNVDVVLASNQLKRSPNIGEQFVEVCKKAYRTFEGAVVNSYQKINILNTLTSDSEVYEKACLMNDNEWKVFSVLNTFIDALRIPSSVKVPSSSQIIGNNQSVSSSVYQKTVKQLKEKGFINPATFSDYSTGSLGPASEAYGSVQGATDVFSAFKIPWGEIQLYSSLSDDTIDFPCYPEEIEGARVANYTTMEATLYQYEPWYAYESSGPREQSLTFQIHRDMWTGDHLDGKANDLIRFCEANLYPEYNGSAVNSPTVTLYVHGTAYISGVMTQVQTHWGGPIGQDGWYLQCELTLTINEVAASPLSFSSVRKMNVIGGYGE